MFRRLNRKHRRSASTALLGVLAAASFASVAAAVTFNVDPLHSSVFFKITHFDTSNFYGRFGRVDGTVTVENAVPTALAVRTDAESIDTNSKERDDHLRGPDFFDVKQFPDITFKSTAIQPGKELGTFTVTGELTLHGVTKPLTATLAKTGQGKNTKGVDIVGFETTFTIKRSEFGMSGYLNKGVGDEVTLTVSLESAAQ